jgi:hypothetical protein
MSAELLRQASAIYSDTGLTPDDLARMLREVNGCCMPDCPNNGEFDYIRATGEQS